jgi:hypothetical protein
MIAMANWTPGGFIGEMFKITSSHVPPPAGVPPPVLWGDEAAVRERLGAGAKDLKMTHVLCEFDYPFPPAKVVEFFRQYFGPTQTAFARLDANGQAAFAVDLEKHWSRHNQRNDGTTLVAAEYLEVVAVRR